MTGALERLLSNYESGAATESDGENDEDPSHGSQSENGSAGRYLASESHAILSRMSNDDDDGESSDDMASAEIEDDRNQDFVCRLFIASLDFVCRLFYFELVFSVQ